MQSVSHLGCYGGWQCQELCTHGEEGPNNAKTPVAPAMETLQGERICILFHYMKRDRYFPLDKSYK